MTNGHYNKLLADQRAILISREVCRQRLGAKALAGADREAFEKLRDISPKKLERVLVKRANSWAHVFAAFLVSVTDEGSHRLLLKGFQWRIISVRKSAEVIRTSPPCEKFHEDITLLQARIEERLFTWHTEHEKDLKARRSKKRKRKSTLHSRS